MDLFCPHCTRRVTVPDDKAGLVVNCPLCAKQFMAPSLAPAAAPPPAPPTTSYELGPSPPPPPPPAPKPTVTSVTSAPPAPPPPPLPPGDYTRSFTLHLRGDWLPFVPAVCLLTIVVLSFFGWHHAASPTSLWGLSFGDRPNTAFLNYLVLLLPALALAVASALVEQKLIPIPPALASVIAWKDLLLAVLLTIGFLPLGFDYVSSHFTVSPNPILLPMKVAFRLHLVAVVMSVALFWLQWRKRSNAPPPKLEARW